MATLAQTLANQTNSLLSTGPQTLEGKLTSSKNALRHGFRTQTVVLPTENAEEFAELTRELLSEHRASNSPERTQFVHELAAAMWRHRRAQIHWHTMVSNKIEELLARDTAKNAQTNPISIQIEAHEELLKNSPYFRQLIKWEAAFDRQIRRIHRELAKQIATNEPNLPRIEPKIHTNEPKQIPRGAQIPRNSLCPCGSGQKFKRCCGKDAPPVLGF